MVRAGRRATFGFRLLGLAAVVCLSSLAIADIRITLKNEFINRYRTRVTWSGNFVVDKAHRSPNPGSKDGDLHIAGRSDGIGLASVAEIMNAKDSRAAVDLVHAREGSGNPLLMTGAWRLWCEHGGNTEHVQDEPLSPFATTNPDHVFEIHPLTQIQGIGLLPTFHQIPGFREKDAEEAFQAYENVRSTITMNEDAETTTLRTGMAGYNYVKFKIVPDKTRQAIVEDGRFVPVQVLDLNGELLVRNLYVALVKDSKPEEAVRALPAGGSLTVLGVPRISLQRLWWRTQHSAERPDALEWSLPYEMVIVGVYSDAQNARPGAARRRTGHHRGRG